MKLKEIILMGLTLTVLGCETDVDAQDYPQVENWQYVLGGNSKWVWAKDAQEW